MESLCENELKINISEISQYDTNNETVVQNYWNTTRQVSSTIDNKFLLELLGMDFQLFNNFSRFTNLIIMIPEPNELFVELAMSIKNFVKVKGNSDLEYFNAGKEFIGAYTKFNSIINRECCSMWDKYIQWRLLSPLRYLSKSFDINKEISILTKFDPLKNPTLPEDLSHYFEELDITITE